MFTNKVGMLENKIKELESINSSLIENQARLSEILKKLSEKIEDLESSFDRLNSKDLNSKAKSNLYPSNIELYNSVCNGQYMKDYTIYDTQKAIKLTLQVDRTIYPKSDVSKAVKEVCQQAIEYFL